MVKVIFDALDIKRENCPLPVCGQLIDASSPQTINQPFMQPHFMQLV